MLREQDLPTYFKISYLPIADDAFWNGKSGKESNLPEWNVHFTQKFGQNQTFLQDTVIGGILYKAGTSFYGQWNMKGHNGIDIGYNTGCPVVAPCRLWVTYLQDSSGYGRNVWAETESKQINGDWYKLEMCFGHNRDFNCQPYSWYDIGSILSYGDSTGFSTGSHCHWGIRPLVKKSGSTVWEQMFPDNGYLGWVDPEQFLKLSINQNSMDLSKLEKKLVIEGTGVGRIGIIIGGKLREVKTERVPQACLYVLANNDLGKTISTTDFDSLPKEEDF